MPIENRRAFILRIDHQGKSRDLRAGGAVERIRQQGAAKSLPPKNLIDSQPAHPHGGHGRITRQFLAVAAQVS